MFRGNENETEQQRALDPNEPAPATPGVLVMLAGLQPACHWTPLRPGAPLVFGRSGQADVPVDDPKLSRQHFAIARDGDEWLVEDRGSANGTWIGRERILGQTRVRGSFAIRAGNSVFRAYDDGSRFERGAVRIESGRTVSPLTEPILTVVDDAGRRGHTLLILGESGTGKEELAQRHHRASERRGAFYALNAATIPAGIAEAMLFGKKRGAFSGADRDEQGCFDAADGGTLFLDEVGDLPLEVQPKLLRVLETGEVTPLGTTKTHRVDVRLVTATRRDLDELVETGRFGPDVRERLARRVVTLPPLCERPEEIPFLVKMFAASQDGSDGLAISAEFYEACIAAEWRDRNIRGLLNDVAAAVHDALSLGVRELLRHNLREAVTRPVSRAPSVAPPPAQPPPQPSARTPKQILLARVRELYAKHHGKARKIADELGLSRQRVYVLLREAGISLREGEDEDRD